MTMMSSASRLLRAVLPTVLIRRHGPTYMGHYTRNVLAEKVFHDYTEERHNIKRQTRYGGVSTVTVISGAGIGREVMEGVKEVLMAARAPIAFEEADMEPSENLDKCNEDFVEGLISIRRNGVALKGSIENHLCDPARYSRNIVLRQNLDLYANIVEYKSYPGVKTRHNMAIDMTVVRQNTEGEYRMLEHEPVAGVVENMKIVTAHNSARTARAAFNYAREHGRKQVMIAHRADLLPLADGIFSEKAHEVAAEYPDIEFVEKSVEHVIKMIALKPNAFDVLLMTNLAGSFMTNMMLGLIGSPALVSGRNLGDDYAVFETAHRGKGESMKGKNVANPTAMLNAAVDMLAHLGHDYHACLIGEAIAATINEDCVHTFDLGGTASTQDVIDNVICRLGDVECNIEDFEDDECEE